MAEGDAATPGDRVGFRDIYNAVGSSEKAIKEHITLLLLPLTSAVADHERRLRDLEEKGSREAQEALALAKAQGVRMSAIENTMNAGIERRSGAWSTLGAQRSFLILLGVLATLLVAILNLMDRLSG